VLILEQFPGQVYANIAGCPPIEIHRNICAGYPGSDNIGGDICGRLSYDESKRFQSNIWGE
jgi:hypothetical protein